MSMSSVCHCACALAEAYELFHRVVDAAALPFARTRRNRHGVTPTSGRCDVIASVCRGVRARATSVATVTNCTREVVG